MKAFLIWLTVIYAIFQYAFGYKLWKEQDNRITALEGRPAQVIFVDTPHKDIN